MARFVEGFAFEWDESDQLIVEGNPIGVKASPTSAERDSVELEAQNVRRYLEDSGALERRKRLKKEHLDYLLRGKDEWNRWRREARHIQPMLACLQATELKVPPDGECVPLDDYDLSYANLTSAKLEGVHLRRANLHQAILADADLSHAHLEEANFCRTDLYATKLRHAHLEGANLQGVQLAMTDLTDAHLAGCKVYGLSAWDLKLDRADDKGLIVRYRPTTEGKQLPEETVKVDGLDLAAFMYLALHNVNLSRVVDAAAKKWVLLLGRFADGRKETLDEVARALKKRNLIPIIFDFPRPERRDLIETILLLAGMSAFVIAEITDPRSTPMELLAIASNYGVPIVPILQGGGEPFATLSALRRFRWVRGTTPYQKVEDFIASDLDVVIKWATEEARQRA
jgi:hypothetical protein